MRYSEVIDEEYDWRGEVRLYKRYIRKVGIV